MNEGQTSRELYAEKLDPMIKEELGFEAIGDAESSVGAFEVVVKTWLLRGPGTAEEKFATLDRFNNGLIEQARRGSDSLQVALEGASALMAVEATDDNIPAAKNMIAALKKRYRL